MNSLPTVRRFTSGSVTPSSAARNRSVASTERMWRSRLPCRTSSTRSGSSRLSRPLLTKTQVSWSPTARWTRVAATAESTPPERAQMTRPEPTVARIDSTAARTNDPGVHSPVQPQTPYTKLRRISFPCGVCWTSGWNWMPRTVRPSDRAAIGVLALEATALKPSGRRSTWSP